MGELHGGEEVSATQVIIDRGVKAVPESWMQLLSNVASTWGRPDGANFGLHCATCGKDVTARNGINDSVLTVSCGCREYKSDRYAIL